MSNEDITYSGFLMHLYKNEKVALKNNEKLWLHNDLQHQIISEKSPGTNWFVGTEKESAKVARKMGIQSYKKAKECRKLITSGTIFPKSDEKCTFT